MKRRSRTRTTETILQEFVTHLVDVGGLSPAAAKEYRAVILDFQRRTGLSDLTRATTADVERYIEADREDNLEDLNRYLERTDLAEIDREDLEWLRRELKRRGKAAPEPEH